MPSGSINEPQTRFSFYVFVDGINENLSVKSILVVELLWILDSERISIKITCSTALVLWNEMLEMYVSTVQYPLNTVVNRA